MFAIYFMLILVLCTVDFISYYLLVLVFIYYCKVIRNIHNVLFCVVPVQSMPFLEEVDKALSYRKKR